MKYLLTTSFALCLLLFTQACGKLKTPSPEEACHFQQNSYLQRVSWAGRLPVKMHADSSLSDEQIVSLQKAMQIWNETLFENEQIPQTFQFMGRLNKEMGTTEDKVNVVSVAAVWNGRATEQAETLVRWVNDAIVEADIRINGQKELSTSEHAEVDKLDLVALYVHELGHVLGLLHIDSDQYTSMAAHLDTGNVQRRKIGTAELDALKCEY